MIISIKMFSELPPVCVPVNRTNVSRGLCQTCNLEGKETLRGAYRVGIN